VEVRKYQGLVFDSTRWDGFVFRPDDIVITTPPKCGTTWTQMICALLVFQTTSFDRSLDLISPWLDMLTRDVASVRADLDAQTHRRFIKTHTPWDGLPHDDRVTYICVGRDPRDVFRSWDNHVANFHFAHLLGARERAVGLDDLEPELVEMVKSGSLPRPESEVERFWAWVDDPTPPVNAMSLTSTMHHLQTFWDARSRANIVLLHYDDLKRDLEGEMKRLAARLEIEIADDLWPELVDAASFENMRSRADSVAPDTTNAIWNDNRQFFNRGCSGQWRDLLTEDDLRRYEERVSTLADPEVVDWAHNGANPAR
jgi:aryl sulfotransferase